MSASISATRCIGTSSARGYTTVRSGWLEPPDAFLSRTSVRGWPSGGSAEHPSTLTLLSGEPLAESWDRCAAALRQLRDAGIVQHVTSGLPMSWVDRQCSARLSALLSTEDLGQRNDPVAWALAWIAHHVLGEWRFREAMRLHKGWSLRTANIDTEDTYCTGLCRTPEACVAAALSGAVVMIDRYSAACRFDRYTSPVS